ncbi:MAG TPA: response regulator [Prosthecobacter sp.]|nr:response regulator [Prosthecobacter sp.]
MPSQDPKHLTSSGFAQTHPARILVVEDQPLNQKILGMLLQRLGYAEIAFANDGRQAVAMVPSGAYDLVFMDILMPVMDGIEAARAIRLSAEVTRQPVIVAVSGHVLPSIKEECRAAGMNGFLAKPLTLDDFRRAIPPCLEVGAAQRPMVI